MDINKKNHVTGEWYPSLSNKHQSATLRFRGNCYVVSSAEGTEEELTLSYANEITVSERVGSIARRITFSDGSVFETLDNDGVDHLLSGSHAKRGFFAYVPWLEKFHPRLIGFIGILVILVIGIYKYAIPALVEVAVYVTPQSVPVMLSSAYLDMLDKSSFRKTELPEDKQQALLTDFQKMAFHAPSGEKAYKLHFRDGGSIGANAFALPDGTIIITDQLVSLSKGDNEMLLGVLAHEIGHVEEKHGMRHLYRTVGTIALITMIAGDLGAGVEELISQAGVLLVLVNSRDAELAADRYSVQLMSKAGHDPTALIRFFDIVAKDDSKDEKESSLSVFSTHPATPERKNLVLKYSREFSR